MGVGFITTYPSSAYHHLRCEFESCAWRGVLYTTLCNKVSHWFVTGRWFSPDIKVSSTNKIDRHDITPILLNVVLNTINCNIVKICRWLYVAMVIVPTPSIVLITLPTYFIHILFLFLFVFLYILVFYCLFCMVVCCLYCFSCNFILVLFFSLFCYPHD